MFLDRSAHRMVVGTSRAVISNRRSAFTPASLVLLTNTVPTLVGPSGSLVIESTLGLNVGSLVPAARKSKTSAIGLSTTAVPLNFPDTLSPRARRMLRLARYRIGAPEMVRAMTSRWISEVPSKIV